MRNRIMLFPVIILSSISFAEVGSLTLNWKIQPSGQDVTGERITDFSGIGGFTVLGNAESSSVLVGSKKGKPQVHFLMQDLIGAASSPIMSQTEETERLRVIEDKKKELEGLRAKKVEYDKRVCKLRALITEKEDALRHLDPAFNEQTQKSVSTLKENIERAQVQLDELQKRLTDADANYKKAQMEIIETRQQRDALNEALAFEKTLMADKRHNDMMRGHGVLEDSIEEIKRNMQAAVEEKNKAAALKAVIELERIVPQLEDAWSRLVRKKKHTEYRFESKAGRIYTFPALKTGIQTLITELKSPNTDWEHLDCFGVFGDAILIAANITTNRRGEKHLLDPRKKATNIDLIDTYVEGKGITFTFQNLVQFLSKDVFGFQKTFDEHKGRNLVFDYWLQAMANCFSSYMKSINPLLEPVKYTLYTQDKHMEDLKSAVQEVYSRYLLLREQLCFEKPRFALAVDYIVPKITYNPGISLAFSILSDNTLTVAHRARELDERIRQLSKQQSELDKQKAGIEAEIRQLSDIIERNGNQLIQLKKDLEESKILQTQFEGQEAQIKGELEEERKKFAETRALVSDADRRLSNLATEISAAEEELNAKKKVPENRSAAQKVLLSIACKSKDPSLKRAAEYIEINQLLDTLLSSSPVPLEEHGDITSPTAIESLFQRINDMILSHVPCAEDLRTAFREKWEEAQSSLNGGEDYEQWKKGEAYLTLSNAISHLSLLSSLAPNNLMRKLFLENLKKDFPLFGFINEIRKRFYEHIAKHFWSEDQVKKWRNSLIEAGLISKETGDSSSVPQSSSSSSSSPRSDEWKGIKSVAGKAPETADYGHTDLPLPGGRLLPAVHTTISYTKGEKGTKLSWKDPLLIAPLFIRNLLNQKGNYAAQIEQKDSKTFFSITGTFAFDPALQTLEIYNYSGAYFIRRNSDGTITEPAKMADPTEIIISLRTDLSNGWETRGTSYTELQM